MFLLSKCALCILWLQWLGLTLVEHGSLYILYNWYCTLLSIRAGHGRAAPSNLSCDKRGGVLRLNEVWAPRTFVREGKASNLAGSTMVFHQGSTIRRVGVQDVRDLIFCDPVAAEKSELRDLQLVSGCENAVRRTSFQLASEPQLLDISHTAERHCWLAVLQLPAGLGQPLKIDS